MVVFFRGSRLGVFQSFFFSSNVHELPCALRAILSPRKGHHPSMKALCQESEMKRKVEVHAVQAPLTRGPRHYPLQEEEVVWGLEHNAGVKFSRSAHCADAAAFPKTQLCWLTSTTEGQSRFVIEIETSSHADGSTSKTSTTSKHGATIPTMEACAATRVIEGAHGAVVTSKESHRGCAPSKGGIFVAKEARPASTQVPKNGTDVPESRRRTEPSSPQRTSGQAPPEPQRWTEPSSPRRILGQVPPESPRPLESPRLQTEPSSPRRRSQSSRRSGTQLRLLQPPAQKIVRPGPGGKDCVVCPSLKAQLNEKQGVYWSACVHWSACKDDSMTIWGHHERAHPKR